MRPPLRSILAAQHDLLGRILRGGEANLQHIQDATMLLSDLIDAVIQYIHVRRTTIRRVQVDLADMARATTQGLAVRHPEARFILPSSAGANADRALVKTALKELFENAVRHCGRNDPTIELTVDPSGVVPVFSVRDDGSGFAMKYCDKVFQPFEVLEHEAGRRGTGIGLAVVKEIVERHGGRIWAETQPGLGATFSFTLEPLPARAA
jgi:signal transduction histidine kinase